MDEVIRLTYGMDLKKSLEESCQCGCVVTCVGCVYEAVIRLADGQSVKKLVGRNEIVSLTGTFSADGSHLHISLADEQGQVIGGHLCYGTLVNTTAEVVIHKLDEYQLNRKYDANTGYKELVIVKK